MTSRLARHFVVMARANRLQNHRLHAACARLSHAEWIASRIGFFPSIAATLNHLLIVDWYRLGRGETIARVSRATGFASMAAFAFAFRQVTGMTPSEFLDRS